MTDRLAVTAHTRIAAVIGDPVEHSLSPALHNAAFADTGIDAVYLAMRVRPADLAAAVAGFRAMRLLGASVTVPHKERVALLCDRLAPPADRIGAVNCLCFDEQDGQTVVVGHNTDAGGFVDALERDASMQVKGCRAVLLGAGGAARAVHAGLASEGAAAIEVVARDPDRVTWIPARPWTPDELLALCQRCDLLVDCTPVALDPAAEASVPAAIPIAALPATAVVASLVYHRQPALLAAAAARGLATLSGAAMLVYQGARAFELWTGTEAPVTAMWAAFHAALAHRT